MTIQYRIAMPPETATEAEPIKELSPLQRFYEVLNDCDLDLERHLKLNEAARILADEEFKKGQ